MSALDARIRHLAREELAAAATPAPAVEDAGRLAALEKEVAALRAIVDRLTATPTAPTATADEESRPVVRRTRKAGSE
jgi:hypothetical protein